MILVITEKAIAGRRIASILAGKEVAQQGIGAAPVFKFERSGQQYVVLPLRGHIVDVNFPKHYTPWLGTDLKKLADAPIDYISTEPAIVSALKKLAPEAKGIVVATDADREGEAIGLEAVRFVQAANPAAEVKRAYFSAIIKKDIEDAFSNLGSLDTALADSADARREIDLIWGAVLTRFISLVSGRLGKEFLSAGRVQTPTLALIVDREKARLAFKQETYWEVVAKFEKNAKLFEALHKKGRFKRKEDAEAVLRKRSETAKVVAVKSTKRTLLKPAPFNTTSFLRAATALGFNAGEAMSIAESLYQMGYTSYPRTDNEVYPPNLDLRAILNELARSAEFSKDTEKVLALHALNPSRGKESKDHPPIHPVAAVPKPKLAERQWRIYELIVRRFLATLGEDAETLNLQVELGMNKEPFIANGQSITRAGWKELYPYSVLKEVLLPPLSKGDIVKLKSLESLEKQTQPPVRYSQGSLIKLMEDNGLGTKSTRHEIIRKLYSRRYIAGLKSIEPNKIAFAVIDVLEQYAPTVAKPKMTAELEQEMDQIAASRKTKGTVVAESRTLLGELLSELVQNRSQIGQALRLALREDAIVGSCSCGGQLRTLRSRIGKRFLGCTNYPKCTITFPLPQKGTIIVAGKSCEQCGTPVIKVHGYRYRFEMCIDPNCISKAEWGKKKEEAAAAKAARVNPTEEKIGAEKVPGAAEKTAAGKKPARKRKAAKGKS